jgi:hypothetical protein
LVAVAGGAAFAGAGGVLPAGAVCVAFAAAAATAFAALAAFVEGLRRLVLRRMGEMLLVVWVMMLAVLPS